MKTIRGSAAVLARSISGLRPQASGSQAHRGPPLEDLEEFRREVNTQHPAALLGQRCESYAFICREQFSSMEWGSWAVRHSDPARVDAEMVRGCSSGRIRQASRSLLPPTSHVPRQSSARLIHTTLSSHLCRPTSHLPPPPATSHPFPLQPSRATLVAVLGGLQAELLMFQAYLASRVSRVGVEMLVLSQFLFVSMRFGIQASREKRRVKGRARGLHRASGD